VGGTALGTALPAGAATSHTATAPRTSATATAATTATSTPSVSSHPVAYTPFLTSSNSTIRQLVPIGSTIYAVGTFSQIGTPDGKRYTRHNLFAFNAVTGKVLPWAPRTSSGVFAATPSMDGHWLFIGGTFTRVNGHVFNYLAKISTSTGALSFSFRAHANKDVEALRMHSGHLLVGGKFTSIGGVPKTALASLHGTTGRADGYVRVITLSGNVGGTSPGPTRVVKLVRNHARSQLLVLGSFSNVSGHARKQIFMLNLNRNGVALNPWFPPQFSLSCAANTAQYVRAAAWGPNDARIAVATTGDNGPSPLCDAVALFRSIRTAHMPLWVNRTGCDSLYSVAVRPDAVYVGGHERWLNNNACDSAGSTAVSRPGVSAVGQASGKATSWDPTRDRGVGADDMLDVATGLWIASDNNYNATRCGGAYHPGLCMFPHS
jgi:hypothetical protein